jgi:lipopolysaccharide export system protein LptA
MIAHYNSAGNDAKGTIKEINVIGHVVVTKGDQIAKGDQGVYKVGSEILELEGNVILAKGENIVKGNKLIYNLKDGTSQILSNSGREGPAKSRVKAVFTSKPLHK